MVFKALLTKVSGSGAASDFLALDSLETTKYGHSDCTMIPLSLYSSDIALYWEAMGHLGLSFIFL
jgi:hypothetical protein